MVSLGHYHIYGLYYRLYIMALVKSSILWMLVAQYLAVLSVATRLICIKLIFPALEAAEWASSSVRNNDCKLLITPNNHY